MQLTDRQKQVLTFIGVIFIILVLFAIGLYFGINLFLKDMDYFG